MSVKTSTPRVAPVQVKLQLPLRIRGSLARTSLVLLLPLVVGPLATLTVLLYSQVQANITDQVTAQLTSVADLKQLQIDQWAVARTADMNNLVRSPDILQYTYDLVLEPAGSAKQVTAGQALSERLENYMGSYGNVEYKAFMVVEAATGRVLLSTSLYQNQVDKELFLDEQYFRTARQGALVAPPKYDPRIDPNDLFLIAAGPLTHPQEGTIAVLMGVIIPSQLQQIVSPVPGLGATSRAYVITGDGYEFGQLITPTTSKPTSTAIQRALVDHASEDDLYVNPNGHQVLGAYRWMPRLELALFVEIEANEANAPVGRVAATLAVISSLAIIVAIAGVILFTRYLTVPIRQLTTSALRMAGGDLNVATETRRSDEIGALSNAFNSMAHQLRDLLGTLEQRVAERTQTAEHRALQVTAGADIARIASTELDPNKLLQQVVDLIRERFNLYYVGAFLADENNRFAVLRAGTGEAGMTLLARNHRLEIGGQSMIGRSMSEHKARIALDVGLEAVRFSNPVLPHTRSEMALPLVARDRAIGALTIQSDQSAAFSDEDILSLQGMADLIAVAIDNARLYQESRRALDEVTALHKSYISQAWTTFAQAHSKEEGQPPTYVYADQTLSRGAAALPALAAALAAQKPVIAASESASTVTVPIRLRDQVIGVVAIESDSPDHQWDPGELALIEAVIEQTALSLENARLIEEAETALAETRRLAAREQIVNTIGSKLRRLPSVESVLTTALVELGRTLGASKGAARLGAASRRTITAEAEHE